jgi:molecular chaperone GrpE
MEEENKKHEDKKKEQSATAKDPADEMEELKKKCEEYLNGWKRERADFLNYKNQETERIANLLKYANEELILNLLPILDNFCLAEKHISDTEESAGFLQIKKQLEDLIAKQGIEVIEVMDKPFDPNTMEAVGEVPTDAKSIKDAVAEEVGGSPRPPETELVVEEVQRGYTMYGKIIRPAKVKVTK